jgi:decaprenylphospho-beta-D-erythro-pentofuranosid-2-ulose 2-reductase
MADGRTEAGRLRVLALGATSAIAEATLRLLAEQGASFVLVARSEAKLSAVRDDLLTRGASAVTGYVSDLNETESHSAMLTEAISALGGLDLALIAHGVLGDQAEAEREYAAAEAILVTNLLSTVSLVGWLANYFEAEHRGTIAVISSVAGDRGRKSNYVYGASKGGLNVYLEGVRNRVDRAGVNVLTIKPGFVATPMTAHLSPNALFAQPAQVAQAIARAIRKRKDVVYVPGFWRWIMLVVRLIPEPVFKRVNL